MSTSFGRDLALLSSFSPLFPTISGPRLVVYGVYRRWTTAPDTVAGRRVYQSQCRDVRHLLAARVDRAELAGWERDLAEIAKVDERVEDCRVLIAAEKKLTLRGGIVTAAGPFTLVIPFDDFQPQVADGIV